jgi:hypothetical protein
MIRDFEIYHGIVFARLLNASSAPISTASYPSSSNASYFLENGGHSAGMYIKYSTKRLSPWRFTFLQEHQGEIDRMKAEFGEVFLILVCGKNGIVVLNHDELKSILDHNHDPAEWVSVARGKRQMYTVKGKDGALDCKIGETDFPRKILDYLRVENASAPGEFQDNLRLHALA